MALVLTPLFNPFVLFLVSFTLLLLLRTKKAGKYNLPPSPPRLPIIGNLHQLGLLPHCSLRTLSDKYGPLLLLHLGEAPALVVSSAYLAEEIMKTHDMIFSNRHKPIAADILFYGGNEIGFSPYGEKWREMKKLCVTKVLSQKRVQVLSFIREEEVADMIAKIRQSCSEKVPVNLSGMIFTAANNIICRSALGRKYEGEVNGKQFVDVARKVLDLLVAFSFRDFFPSIGWMDKVTGLVSRFQDTFKELDAFLDQVIKEHECRRSENEQSEKDVLDILLHLRKDNMLGFDLTLDNVKGILVDIMIAGGDTNATTMVWLMTELARHPRAMKRAQEEVRRVLGMKEEIDLDDISQVDYLRCIIKETLRLHPPGPFLIPRETKTWVKLEGYDIAPHTRILINSWAIQRDPKLWEMPEEFLPERFLDSPIEFNSQHFQFIPFGAGRRGCPGMPFAIASMEYMVANLLYWFNWELPMGTDAEHLDMSEQNGMVVCKRRPLYLVPTSYDP